MKKFGENIHIGLNVEIGKNVKIGQNTIIYDNVVIGDNTIIGENCIIGEPLFQYFNEQNYRQPATIFGSECHIRSFNVIYAGTSVGTGVHTGHFVTIRENTKIGQFTLIGTKCDIQGECEIGDYVRLHSYVVIGQYSKIKNYVQMFPYVVLTNDSKPPSNELIGPFIDEFAVIATGSIIGAGIKIGKHALVGANSFVNHDVETFAFVNGNPAKFICDVRKLPVFTNNRRHYPWPYNFSRNLPWDGIDFDEWAKK